MKFANKKIEKNIRKIARVTIFKNYDRKNKSRENNY
jgi:hypothetical protein